MGFGEPVPRENLRGFIIEDEKILTSKVSSLDKSLGL